MQSKSVHPLGFLDETGLNTKMDRCYGWGESSSRVIGQVPLGHWQTTTFIAGLRSAGLIAPLVLDGPMNSECFLAYIQQFLAPTLNRGDLVILDNLSSHKHAGGQEAIRSAGADVLYCLPLLLT